VILILPVWNAPEVETINFVPNLKMNLDPVPGQRQDGRHDPGHGHHPPGLGHGAHAARLERVDDGVEPLHTHAGQVQHRADDRDVLNIECQLADQGSEGSGEGKESEKLDGQTNHNQEEISRGEAGEEGVRGGLERGFLHDSEDDQDVARDSKTKGNTVDQERWQQLLKRYWRRSHRLKTLFIPVFKLL